MSLAVTISVGRLLSRNEKLTTAKFNAVVKSIVINISGSVGNSDLVAGAVTYDKASPGPWFFETATFDGNQTYTVAFSPAITSYVDGTEVAFQVPTTNPGPVYLDAGGGALPILKHGGLQVLDKGDLLANAIGEARYNATLVAGGCWELLSLLGRPTETTPFVGCSAFLQGQSGVLPAPNAGQQNLYFRADGTWQDAVAAALAAAAGVVQQAPIEILKQQNFL